MNTTRNIKAEEYERAASTAKEMRSMAARERRTTVAGKEFVIDPEVFNPDGCYGTIDFLNNEIVQVIEEEIAKKYDSDWFDFLEVGCGAGYTAVHAALASEKSRVWATDINEASVKNAMENAKLYEVEGRLKAVVADVFDNEEITGRKFDMIYWNVPWAGQFTEPGTHLEPPIQGIIDPGYQSLRRFLSDANGFLKKRGRLFVGFSFRFGSEELFRSVASETGWRFEIRSSENFVIEIADVQEEIDVAVIEFFNKEA